MAGFSPLRLSNAHACSSFFVSPSHHQEYREKQGLGLRHWCARALSVVVGLPNWIRRLRVSTWPFFSLHCAVLAVGKGEYTKCKDTHFKIRIRWRRALLMLTRYFAAMSTLSLSPASECLMSNAKNKHARRINILISTRLCSIVPVLRRERAFFAEPAHWWT